MTTQTENTVDVTVENHGSLFRFNLHTDAAREWVDENVQIPDYMRMGPGSGASFHCEHRYAEAIAHGMRDAGLEVE